METRGAQAGAFSASGPGEGVPHLPREWPVFCLDGHATRYAGSDHLLPPLCLTGAAGQARRKACHTSPGAAGRLPGLTRDQVRRVRPPSYFPSVLLSLTSLISSAWSCAPAGVGVRRPRHAVPFPCFLLALPRPGTPPLCLTPDLTAQTGPSCAHLQPSAAVPPTPPTTSTSCRSNDLCPSPQQPPRDPSATLTGRL